MHSNYSPDSTTPLDALVRQARELEFDRIALTDHGTAEGALELALREPGLAIVGEEVRTTEGEIIGLFLVDSIEPGGTPEEVVEEIHRQGGVSYVPHPLDPYRWHFSEERLLELAPRIDVVETHNQWCRDDANAAAVAIARRMQKPGACGSDAHVAAHMAHCWLEIEEFDDAQGFLANLPHARQVINARTRR
jgi:predicted metal-dependent phosphoesterase TrpH